MALQELSKRYYLYKYANINDIYIVDENGMCIYTNNPNWKVEVNSTKINAIFVNNNFLPISLDQYIKYKLLG